MRLRAEAHSMRRASAEYGFPAEDCADHERRRCARRFRRAPAHRRAARPGPIFSYAGSRQRPEIDVAEALDRASRVKADVCDHARRGSSEDRLTFNLEAVVRAFCARLIR